jgi:N-methylhydantoinase B
LSDTTVSVLGDRVDHAPFGICGGGSAESNSVTFHTKGRDWQPELRSKQEKEELVAGDSIRVGSPGGGGWGNPLQRDLDAVTLDLNRGYISPEQATELYGVVIEHVTPAKAGTPRYRLDAVASEKQRASRTAKT